MSVGIYLDAFYESDTGEIHNIRIQPETASLVIGGVTNTIPAGPATNAQQIKVSASRGEFGVKARKVRVEVLTAGTSGLTPGSVIELPWLQSASFLDVTRPSKQEGTYYLGATVKVIGGTPETFN